MFFFMNGHFCNLSGSSLRFLASSSFVRCFETKDLITFINFVLSSLFWLILFQLLSGTGPFRYFSRRSLVNKPSQQNHNKNIAKTWATTTTTTTSRNSSDIALTLLSSWRPARSGSVEKDRREKGSYNNIIIYIYIIILYCIFWLYITSYLHHN